MSNSRKLQNALNALKITKVKEHTSDDRVTSILLKKTSKKAYTFDHLIAAIQDGDLDKVALIIAQNDQWLVNTNNENEYPLHIALKTANDEITAYILKRMQTAFSPMDFTQALHAKTKNGDSALHLAVATGSSENMEVIFNSYTNKAEAMHQFNSEGLLPIHLLTDRIRELTNAKNQLLSKVEDEDQFDEDDIEAENKQIREIGVLLEPYLINEPTIKLSDQLALQQILDKFKTDINNNHALALNIFFGCMAVNFTRNRIKASCTHPSTNHLSREDAELLTAKCTRLKDEWLTIQVRYSEDLTKAKSLLSPHNVLDKIQAECIDKTYQAGCDAAVGDCFVFAMTTAHLLLKMGVQTSIQLADILPNGDHNFVVLGEGESAVLIDAWAGEVYPLKYANQYLHGYTSYYSFQHQTEANYIFPIDPAVHRINLNVFLWKFSEDFLKQNTMAKNSFTLDEQIILEKDKKRMETYLTTQHFLQNDHGALSGHLGIYSPANINLKNAILEDKALQTSLDQKYLDQSPN